MVLSKTKSMDVSTPRTPPFGNSEQLLPPEPRGKLLSNMELKAMTVQGIGVVSEGACSFRYD
jgi:hypothetical protein